MLDGGKTQCRSTEIAFATCVISKHSPIFCVEIHFRFPVLGMRLNSWSTTINTPYVMLFCGCSVECVVWPLLLGCCWVRRWVSVLGALFMGLLPQNTVCILVVPRNLHTFTILRKSGLSPISSLAHEVTDFVKYVLDFLQMLLIMIIFFLNEMDFCCIKLKFSLQWYTLKWKIFAGPRENIVPKFCYSFVR
jgi:hypothetical protein